MIVLRNEYEIRGDVTAIIINSPKYGLQEALISTNKLEKVREFPNSWHLKYAKGVNDFYVFGSWYLGNRKQKPILLHRWITNAQEGLVVDHINHETLDNTDLNLRVITHSGNQQNRKNQQNNKSGVRGVYWNKRANKWHAQITLNDKRVHIGHFDDLKDAERSVISARMKYMPFSNETI